MKTLKCQALSSCEVSGESVIWFGQHSLLGNLDSKGAPAYCGMNLEDSHSGSARWICPDFEYVALHGQANNSFKDTWPP